jgi:hypothetical protein
MAEEATKVMVEETTPKKTMFMNRPYSQEERIKKDEEELEQLLKEQKGEVETKTEEAEDKKEEEPTSAEEKTFKKRYGDLRRHTQQKEEDYKKEILRLKEQIADKTTKDIKLPKSEEELASWSSKYPDVAQVIETIATKKAKELDSSLEERMKLIAEKEAHADRAKAEAELVHTHPDFDDIRNDQNFHDWVEKQPKWIQQALYENDNDAKSASRAIDLYKVDMGLIKTKSSVNNKDAAKAVSKGTATSPASAKVEQADQIRESQVQKMSAQQFEKNEDAIMAAIRSGNFIYDVTRPNI